MAFTLQPSRGSASSVRWPAWRGPWGRWGRPSPTGGSRCDRPPHPPHPPRGPRRAPRSAPVVGNRAVHISDFTECSLLHCSPGDGLEFVHVCPFAFCTPSPAGHCCPAHPRCPLPFCPLHRCPPSPLLLVCHSLSLTALASCPFPPWCCWMFCRNGVSPLPPISPGGPRVRPLLKLDASFQVPVLWAAPAARADMESVRTIRDQEVESPTSAASGSRRRAETK